MSRYSQYLVLGTFLMTCLASTQLAQSRGKSVLLTLKNGESIEGRIVSERKGRVHVSTWLGRREIPAISIIARRDAASLKLAYKKEFQKTEKDSLKARIRLARWCLARGFTSGLAAELDAIIRLDSDNQFAWGLIRKMAPVYRLAKANTQPTSKPRWARKEVDLLYAAARKQSFLGAAIIRTQLDGLVDDIQLNEAIKHSGKGTEPQRWIAAMQLGESKSVRRVKPLYRRALGDPSKQVREAAVQSLKRHDDGTTIGPFIKALFQGKFEATRAHAAQALGQLGDKRAVAPLMAALKQSGSGGAARNHVRIGRQQAYIKDYDVEIAQAAVIADPIVDITEEGVVLDAAVVSIEIRRRIMRASLHQLTGVGASFSNADWGRWWKENKARFPTR